MMTRTRPIALHHSRIRLIRKPTAAAEARGQVRAVIRAWQVPVDPDIAIVLTSDLVTYAITHWDGATITLAIGYSRDQLRVDVCDGSRFLPMAAGDQVVAETGPGLALVAFLSAEWGSFMTPAGKAMFFALACQA